MLLNINELTHFFSQCTIPLLLDFLAVLLHLVLVQDLEATHFQVSTVKILQMISRLNSCAFCTLPFN